MKLWKEKPRPGSLGRITQMLAVGFLALWLGCMGCITIAVAQTYYSLIRSDAVSYIDFVKGAEWERINGEWTETGIEAYWEEAWEDGQVENFMIQRASYSYQGYSPVDGEKVGAAVLRDIPIHYETAAVYADADGNIYHGSGDYLRIQYQTEEEWQERGMGHGGSRYAWVDISDRDDPRYAALWERLETGQGVSVQEYYYTRIVGYLDGTKLEPMKLEYITLNDYAMKAREDLTWELAFDATDTVTEPERLITVYGTNLSMNAYNPEHGVWYQGKRYENLRVILREGAAEAADPAMYFQNSESEGNLLNVVHLDAREIWDTSGEKPELQFVICTAIQASPLLEAMKSLVYVYLGTFLLSLICLVMIRSRIRDHLIAPIREANDARRKDWALINFDNDPPRWREAWEVQHDYVDSREYRRMKENEIKRLETALEYARTAEENRRQMTSNIAHELKTPLAVVHSYAEGLQAHIAEEKRDKYLEVILSETERMDAMVLEMLDLSRLEAGKVKLARDDFDLVELAKSVFDTLQIQAEAKGLGISLQFPEKAMVAADEGRIRQVVENFASNAVKYTAAGGSVAARIFREGGKTVFAVENDSQPLSDEALEKVWDTFWRVDESRTGGVGTGLGLAIARSIVELHGGRVGVQNTEKGVEFRFAI